MSVKEPNSLIDFIASAVKQRGEKMGSGYVLIMDDHNLGLAILDGMGKYAEVAGDALDVMKMRPKTS